MRPFTVRTADGAFVLQCYDFVVENAVRSCRRRHPQHNVLLLHCNGINCLAYKAVVEQLVKRNVRVVTYDQRGHGGFLRHVVVREGFASLGELDESEEDLLDRAWGLEPQSRLSCQAIVGQQPLVIDIPRYSINHAKERH